jgi:hypothetical protein
MSFKVFFSLQDDTVAKSFLPGERFANLPFFAIIKAKQVFNPTGP